MRIRSKKHLIGLFVITATLFLSFSSNHPAGNTGAPGDGICSNCHGGGGFTGSVDISGLPGTVIPNQTYNVTVTLNVSSGSPVRAGFQIVSLLDANDTNAGDWTNNSGSSSLITSGGREYFGHSPFKNFGGGSSVSWDADWTAPSVSDNVTFYAVGNFANGNGSTSGDRIITGTETVFVDGGTDLTISITAQSDVSCFNGNDGSATALAEGGMMPYAFEWDNGNTSATANDLDAGNHTVIVTDDNGDTAETSVVIGEPNEILADPIIEHISCFDEEDGFADVNPFGGTGTFECEWSAGLGIGCEQDGLASGVYFVTITDENFCSSVVEIEIFEPSELFGNVTSTDETTAGAEDGTATAIPTGGNPPYDYVWSDGTMESGSISTIEDLAPGTYSVMIIDDNNCIVEESVTVMAGGCGLFATSIIEDVDCFNNSNGNIFLNVSNGIDPITFAWSDGSTSQNLSNVGGGNYNVMITDGAGCTEMINNLVVFEPDSLNVQTIAVVDATCPDSQDGSIIVNVSGGIGNYDLVWSNGTTNDTIINGMDTLINIPDTLVGLDPGMYAYMLADGNNCLKFDTFLIINSDNVAPTLIIEQGNVLLGPDGTAPAPGFDVIDAGSFDNCGIDSISFITPSYDCSDIGSYNYPVTLFDANGNMTTGMATINVFETMPPTMDCSGLNDIITNSCDVIEFDTPTATDNCVVEQLLLIEGLPSGSSFPSGTTTVTFQAIDECNNTSQCSFTVTVNIDLALNIISQDVSCPGESDGVIDPSATGGTPPYTFNIDSDTLSAGTYVVILMDSGGCSDMETVVIEEPMAIEYDIPVNDVSCFGASDGEIIIDLPDNTSWDFDGDPSMLTAGQYEITITNAGTACVQIETVEVNEPEELAFTNVIVENALCADGTDCKIGFAVVGGTGPITFTTSPELDLCDGPVSIFVEDANGCTLDTTIILDIPDPIEISLISINPSTGSDGSIDVTVEGGAMPYSYSWMDLDGVLVANTEDLTDLAPGMYTISIIDSNGCIAMSATYEVEMKVSTLDLDKDSNQVVLTPNPASDELQIRFVNNIPLQLDVYNINSVKVYQKEELKEREWIDINNLTAGIYIMKLEYHDITVIKTFIKI